MCVYRDLVAGLGAVAEYRAGDRTLWVEAWAP